MKILTGFRYDHGLDLTTPFPPKRSIMFRVIGGDWLDPVGFDLDWFKPPHPKHIIHFFIPLWASWLLLIASTSLLIGAILFAPWWAGIVAAVVWLLTPGKFIAWRWDKRGGYAGSKVYGVDAPVYKAWLCEPVEVYEGSLASCLSIRPFASLGD